MPFGLFGTNLRLVRSRKRQIVDAAADLISARGYAETSIDDVIGESGLSGKSHFYHYFKSKEELGVEVLEREAELFAERGLAILREPMIAPLDRLALFIDTLVATQLDRHGRGVAFGNLASKMAHANEEFRKRIESVFDRWARQIRSLLREAHGELREGVDAARLARFVIATLEGALLMSRVTRDRAALLGIATDLKRFVSAHRRDVGDGSVR